MKLRIGLTLIALISFCRIFPQSLNKLPQFDLLSDKMVYTIGYTHLDSEWNWDYTTTISEYIPNILHENFYLFGKYPQYVFNFTGARRYKFMKEYYPEEYEKVKKYIMEGRWNVAGSSIDEGEVLISSPESIIRQILYGNNFFRQEFEKESMDYMLPDCFGFPSSLPSILHHAGLIGFSTQKLGWGSAVGMPFNVGVWKGPDGNGIVAALNGTDYTGGVPPRFDLDSAWDARLYSNFSKTGLAFDYRYYGVGDKGGAPRETDVRRLSASINNPDSKFKVLLTSSDQMFKDITPDIKKSLPEYSGDLLLTEHSSGSLTSQVFMKRINRKNENLAQASEYLASAVSCLSGSEYPFEKLNNSWELVLGSQMHDIITGTSIPKAYEYAWNDEFVALNGFSDVFLDALKKLSGQMNTEVKGRPVTVFNPVAKQRNDVAVGVLIYETIPEYIRVFNPRGEEVPSQILEKGKNHLKFIFLADIPPVGFTVYDVRESTTPGKFNADLSVSKSTIENEYYRVRIDENGDISGVYDKNLKMELLKKPARLEFLREKPFWWPAWNMEWKDRSQPVFDYLCSEPTTRVLEDGPIRVALEIKRKGRNSEIIQIVSLTSGEAGKRIEIMNSIDWQSSGVSLKASFPLTIENEFATYNLGTGTIQRNNNHDKKFEVPFRQWMNLTDKSGKYGVSILEDSRYGSDKPDNNTLRLTLMYTPKSEGPQTWYYHQNSQDWGIHKVKYGIYSHSGNWEKSETPWQAEFFNKPLVTFESPGHPGKLGREVSFLQLSSDKVNLMAFKKAENMDYYIIRVNELTGKNHNRIQLTLPFGITDAFEVNGQEERIGDLTFDANTISFKIGCYGLRSFAVKFNEPKHIPMKQVPVNLPFNTDIFSNDHNRTNGNMEKEIWNPVNYPAELVPPVVNSEGIRFNMGSTADENFNAVSCQGQMIHLPEGDFNKVYILAAALNDLVDTLIIGKNSVEMKVNRWTGFIGQHFNRKFDPVDDTKVIHIDEPYYDIDNIAWFSTHVHFGYPSNNQPYMFGYMFKYMFDLEKEDTNIQLPDNENIKVFAITVVEDPYEEIKLMNPLFDDFKENQEFKLRGIK